MQFLNSEFIATDASSAHFRSDARTMDAALQKPDKSRQAAVLPANPKDEKGKGETFEDVFLRKNTEEGSTLKRANHPWQQGFSTDEHGPQVKLKIDKSVHNAVFEMEKQDSEAEPSQTGSDVLFSALVAPTTSPDLLEVAAEHVVLAPGQNSDGASIEFSEKASKSGAEIVKVSLEEGLGDSQAEKIQPSVREAEGQAPQKAVVSNAEAQFEILSTMPETVLVKQASSGVASDGKILELPGSVAAQKNMDDTGRDVLGVTGSGQAAHAVTNNQPQTSLEMNDIEFEAQTATLDSKKVGGDSTSKETLPFGSANTSANMQENEGLTVSLSTGDMKNLPVSGEKFGAALQPHVLSQAKTAQIAPPAQKTNFSTKNEQVNADVTMSPLEADHSADFETQTVQVEQVQQPGPSDDNGPDVPPKPMNNGEKWSASPTAGQAALAETANSSSETDPVLEEDQRSLEEVVHTSETHGKEVLDDTFDTRTSATSEPKKLSDSPLVTAAVSVQEPFSAMAENPETLFGLDDIAGVSGASRDQDVARDMSAPTSVAHRNELPTRVAMQVAEVARQLPDRPVEITLTPEELGKVRLSFQMSENGAMHVVIAAERPETMDLLRRNIDSLAGEFKDLGYSDSGFSFESFDQGTQNNDAPDLPSFERMSPSQAMDETVVKTPEPVRLSLGSGMDLRL